jgi:hypothetical protein
VPWQTLAGLGALCGGIAAIGGWLGNFLYAPKSITPNLGCSLKAPDPFVLNLNEAYSAEFSDCYLNGIGMTMGGVVGTIDPAQAPFIGALPGVIYFLIKFVRAVVNRPG